MKIKILFLSVLFTFANLSYAQDARSILDKASKAYENAKGIKAKFTLENEDTINKMTYTQSGVAHLFGNKFQFDTPDYALNFDGTTQWTYSKDANEVSITEPNAEDLQGISPWAMLNLYKTGFDLKYKGEKTVKGKVVIEVEMIPQKALATSTEMGSIIVQVDKKTSIFSHITVKMKNGYNTTIIINDIETNLTLTDKVFVFDEKQYANVEVVDLR